MFKVIRSTAKTRNLCSSLKTQKPCNHKNLALKAAFTIFTFDFMVVAKPVVSVSVRECPVVSTHLVPRQLNVGCPGSLQQIQLIDNRAVTRERSWQKEQ